MLRPICKLLLILALLWPASSWGADPTRTNVATGTGSTATTNASFGFTATAGRLLVVAVAADDYKTGDPSGYTLSTGMSQQVNHGAYVWWKIASGGETSVSYTIGSATNSAWAVTEWDNVDAAPYDTSAGQNDTSSGTSYTTPAITPSTGRRLLLAVIGASGTVTWTGTSAWTNSFTEQAESFQNVSGTRDIVGVASRIVDGDGSTTFSSGANTDASGGNPWDTATGQIIAFKVATGGGGAACTGGLMLRGAGGC